MMMDVDSDTGGSDDVLGPSDEEQEVTAYEVLQKLQKAWLNEKLSPELLIPLTGEVDCMLDQLKVMEQNLNHMPPRDEMMKHHKLEIERIRFLVASYLRVRLAKIQKYAWHIRDQENRRRNGVSRLTAEENKFLREYLNLLEGHLGNVALSHMPRGLNQLHPDRVKIVPSKDTYVFFRVIKSTNVTVEDAEGQHEVQVELAENSQYIMKYQPVSELINSNNIQLV